MAGCKCDHGTIVNPPNPPTNICDECLWVGSYIVACDQSIGPCDETGTIAIDTNCENLRLQ